MKPEERQLIGIIASEDDLGGRHSVFINSNSAIQYYVKPLMSSSSAHEIYTGYMSSFEEDEDFDDYYLPDTDRELKFMHSVDDKLFIFNYRPTDGEFVKMSRVNVVQKPIGFNPSDCLFNAVPVFGASDDETITEWEMFKRWKLYRDYKSLDAFYEAVKAQKSVGSIYGFDAEKESPSFVIWKDKDEKLFAVGKINNMHYNSLRGLILDGGELFKIDISDYVKFLVYDIDVNPTLSFIPESIYKEIEDRILKAEVTREKENEDKILSNPVSNDENGDNGIAVESEGNNDKNLVGLEFVQDGIQEINGPSDEKLEEIDTKLRTDEVLIQLMDYHSQKRGLYYSMSDFVNVHTAIKCSNLVILSGLSGTGKSAMVEIYARALGINVNSDDDRLLFIPVRPSWNDDADLLGYVDLVHNVYRPSDTGFVDFLVNAQKEDNKGKLFIVCFDEMNLARVEHYFSQFLSLLERPASQRVLQLYDNQYTGRLYNSKDYPSSILIGDNIRFVGTVNIDESTYHFSDKVLDRANVIELDVLNYSLDWIRKQYASIPSATWSKDDYDSIIKKSSDIKMDEVQNLLWDIHTIMQNASAKYGVGPRIVKSIKMYLNNLPEQIIDGFDKEKGLDYQIMQRVLTKVRGPEIQIGSLLNNQSENSFEAIFEKYSNLSDFTRCRKVILQKQKELETYGYCI